jgi:DNA-binding SARP family transcriptional activator
MLSSVAASVERRPRLHRVPPSGTPPWRFSVLGPVRAWHAAQELDLGPPQQRAVLAMLLLRGGAWADLADLTAGLWGDQPPPRAVGILRTYISRLRRLLSADQPGGLIVTTAGGYRIRAEQADLDLDRFRDLVTEAAQAATERRYDEAAAQLASGLALFGGPALTGLPGPYAAAQRDRLERMRVAAEEERLVADLELGHHAQVVADLGPLIAAEPLRERFREMLMLALWRLGRPADALAAFQQARTTLATELGIEPSTGLRRLQQSLLAGDELGRSALPAPPAAVSPMPVAVTPVPAQAPAPPADFTGRAELLSQITGALHPSDAVPVVGVVGLPGTGKSTLAAALAQQVADRFPDGVLHADLGGHDHRPLRTADVLTAWLRALGHAGAHVPTEPAELVAFWRTVLAGRRVLVVLDDADGSARAQPLLPAVPGCAALLTSTRHLADLPGSEWYRLGPFTPGESTAYLGRRLGAGRVAAEPAAVERLASARGNAPMALRMLAGRLAARPAWRMADAEQWLEPDDDAAGLYQRLDVLRADLDAGQSRVFLEAAAAEGGVSAARLAATLGCSERGVAVILDALADRSLLVADEPGRYRAERIVQRYARLRRVVAVRRLSSTG